MVGPVGKTPRHTLTPAQKQQCLEAQLRERRLRRAAEMEERENAEVAALQKKAAAKTTAAEAKAATPGATVAPQVKNVAPAVAKPTGKKTPSRKKAPAEMLATWTTDFAPGPIASQVAEAATPKPPPDTMTSEVVCAMAFIVTAIVEEKRQDGAPAARTTNTSSGSRPTGSGKRKRVDMVESRKLRRGLLQEERVHDIEELSSAENDTTASGEEVVAVTTRVLVNCVVDGGPNLMPSGAAACTNLNSDEDPDLREEPEDEEDVEYDDCWDGDWDIGLLTDEESDAECEELPESVCLFAAEDSKYITAMRDIGWKYNESKFGPDPTYVNLYDGPYGHTHNP
ncbi:Pol protein [Phytophthora cinnamomi]|uniref:Pol protein n=1 Tax=Phytophthora cinnamomi TaxID=4785 RepID=UPI002A2959D0|nr:Pol protein [Phytophthora cinnamomi]KAJ8542500.1 hypothetical protein ON010_g12313 [Phytophthora cinnamomi]